jgi:hypothetical protein
VKTIMLAAAMMTATAVATVQRVWPLLERSRGSSCHSAVIGGIPEPVRRQCAQGLERDLVRLQAGLFRLLEGLDGRKLAVLVRNSLDKWLLQWSSPSPVPVDGNPTPPESPSGRAGARTTRALG